MRAQCASGCSSREVVNEVLPSRTHRRRPYSVLVAASATASMFPDLRVPPLPPGLPPPTLPNPMRLSPQPAQPLPAQQQQQQQQYSAPQHSTSKAASGSPTPGSGTHAQTKRLRPQHRSSPDPLYDLRQVWKAPRPDHSQLTTALKGSVTCSELLDIVQANQGSLNPINLAAAFNRTAALYKQPHSLRALDSRLVSSQLIPLLLQELRAVKMQMQPRAISTTLHALGVLDIRDREIFADLAGLAEAQMAEFTSQGLGNILWAYARSGLQPSARWMALYVGVCHTKLATFSAQDLAMVMWSFAKLKYRLSEGKQHDFLAASAQLLHKSSPQALSMVIYSLVYMELHPGAEYINTFCSCLTAKPHGLNRFQPQGLSNILWALSRINHPPQPALWKALNMHLLATRLDGYKPVDVATLVYAVAKLEVPVYAQLLNAFCSKVSQCMFNMQPSHLANVGLALAHMRFAPSARPWHPALPKEQLTQQQQEQRQQQQEQRQQWQQEQQLRPEQQGQQRQQQYELQAQGSHQMSLAHNSEPSQPQQPTQWPERPQLPEWFLLKYISATYVKLSAFNCRDLSMLAQALARLRCQLPANYLTALQLRIEQLGAGFSTPDISLTLWALQRLGVSPSPSLMVEFFQATDKRLSSFKPQELSVMMWALAQANYRPEKAWLDEFLHCTFPRMPQFAPQGLANIVLALSQLEVRPPPAWLYALVKSATVALPSCTVQDLQMLIKGLTAINDAPSGLQLQKVDDFVRDARRTLTAKHRELTAAARAAGRGVPAPAPVGDSDADWRLPEWVQYGGLGDLGLWEGGAAGGQNGRPDANGAEVPHVNGNGVAAALVSSIQQQWGAEGAPTAARLQVRRSGPIAGAGAMGSNGQLPSRAAAALGSANGRPAGGSRATPPAGIRLVHDDGPFRPQSASQEQADTAESIAASVSYQACVQQEVIAEGQVGTNAQQRERQQGVRARASPTSGADVPQPPSESSPCQTSQDHVMATLNGDVVGGEVATAGVQGAGSERHGTGVVGPATADSEQALLRRSRGRKAAAVSRVTQAAGAGLVATSQAKLLAASSGAHAVASVVPHPPVTVANWVNHAANSPDLVPPPAPVTAEGSADNGMHAASDEL